MYLCLSCALLYGVKMPRLCALFSPFHRSPVRECVGFLRTEIIPHISVTVCKLYSLLFPLYLLALLSPLGVYAHNRANFTHTNERANGADGATNAVQATPPAIPTAMCLIRSHTTVQRLPLESSRWGPQLVNVDRDGTTVFAAAIHSQVLPV